MMRKSLFPLALAGLLACAAAGAHAQQSSGGQGQSQPTPSASAPSSSNAGNAAASSGQGESVADAARKARAAKQDSQKPAKVFDNDNIPTTGGISAVGSSGDETGAASSESSTASGASGSSYPDGKDEKGWRTLFSNLKHKLEQDQQLADVAQRELGVDSVQYYSDPMKTMMQQITRSDINKKTAEIEQKKKQVEADKQAIADAQEALRRADGDPGWAE
jgi:parvulin-like peptidyl-prolyl isomerase